jgi:hypothetical protein
VQLLLVRGSTGVVTWTRVPLDPRSWNWVCSRDSFVVAGPTDPAQAEGAAVAIAQHSVGLVGAIAQVVQLDL